ncbi:MAG TPA: hypothetical protein VF696_00710 [Candidatus Paceibacterota bacterium]
MHLGVLFAAAQRAESILNAFLEQDSGIANDLIAEGKFGGYLCLACPEGYPFAVVSIGRPDPGKLDRYLTFSQEKARRLAAHPEHRLSFESRDPEKDQWGGAVRGDMFIVSFSGLPERLDEVLSALILVSCDDVEFQDAMSRIAGNPYVEKLGESRLAAFLV